MSEADMLRLKKEAMEWQTKYWEVMCENEKLQTEILSLKLEKTNRLIEEFKEE